MHFVFRRRKQCISYTEIIISKKSPSVQVNSITQVTQNNIMSCIITDTFLPIILSQNHQIKVVIKSIFNNPGNTKNIMSCIMILASICVLHKFYLHNKREIVCMVVLAVGSEKYQGSELSWVRVVRLPSRRLTGELIG